MAAVGPLAAWPRRDGVPPAGEGTQGNARDGQSQRRELGAVGRDVEDLPDSQMVDNAIAAAHLMHMCRAVHYETLRPTEEVGGGVRGCGATAHSMT